MPLGMKYQGRIKKNKTTKNNNNNIVSLVPSDFVLVGQKK
jgi:hypothetical protein